MMKNIFRSVEFWKSTVMTMPDSSFFELLRNVFGKIKTPFNKQQLINDLEAFLLREDIQGAIAAYIDQNDGKIIAAIALFGEPAPGELESFFQDEFSYAQLQDLTVNLEERFILYRFIEEKTSRLALNPLLKKILSPFAENVSVLFPAIPDARKSGKPLPAAALLNDRIFAGLLSFVSQTELFFRNEGVIRKWVLDTGKTLFPGIDLEQILGGMQMLGLFYADGDKLLPDIKQFNDFGTLSAQERIEYCAAAILVYNEQKVKTDIVPPLFRNRIREITNFIHGFLSSLDGEVLYSEKSLKRLAEILKAEISIDINTGEFFEAMEKTGLVITSSPEIKQICFIAENKTEADRENPLIAADSGFSILVYPEIPYSDVINFAAFMNIREAGTVVRFELDKDSAVRAFDKNISADDILNLLGRLSGGRVNDTLVWHLKDWEKRHTEVSLKRGVILSLSPERRYLAETMPLAGLICETPAEGLYLLNETALEEAASALRVAGIDIVGRPRVEKSKIAAVSQNHFPSPEARASYAKIPTVAPDSSGQLKDTADAAVLTGNFHAILKKMPLGETEKAELSARIDRRLVLCEAQLKDANLRYEKLEARHMDYAGKQNIARQAIAQQSLVEVVWPGGKKDGERVFGVPKTLEKENGEYVLVLIPEGEQSVMRIPVGKISLLRRIKKSIFEVS